MYIIKPTELSRTTELRAFPGHANCIDVRATRSVIVVWPTIATGRHFVNTMADVAGRQFPNFV